MYAQVPVVFAGRDRLSAESAEALRAGLPVYVLASDDLIGQGVIDEARAFGADVTRVAGSSLAAHAVRIAEFRDERTGFGWGRTHDRRTGYFEYVIAAPSDAAAAWAALPLARSNAATLLFAADDGTYRARPTATSGHSVRIGSSRRLKDRSATSGSSAIG